MSTDVEINIDEKIKNDIVEPSKYNVIMINDDHTPMDFVIDVLEKIFKHSRESAENLTLTIHNEGSAVIGTYTYELAEQKATETVNLSRNNGFPLQLKIDEER
jgi:ATP-dependent Clp protease adaptor protein ClpS